MADQYQNPTKKPCSGTYSWVPVTTPNIGGVNPIRGFANLIIDRGAFRNYWVLKNAAYPPKDDEKNVTVSVPKGITTYGYSYSPVVNATRPLSLDIFVKEGNGDNFVVTTSSSEKFLEFIFKTTDASRALSCIQFEYDASYAYESVEQSVIAVYGVTQSGEEKLIKNLKATRLPSNVSASDLVFANSTTPSVKFITEKIKTSEATDSLTNRNAYPKYKSIFFKNINSSQLTFTLKKIMFFTADRVNFRYIDDTKQLPCAALGYSMLINGSYYPNRLAFAGVWPQQGRVKGANAHFKIFNPDFVTNSPGFAHSLNVRLQIVSFPIFPNGSIGFTIASTLLGDIASPYYGVIIGPTPFTQQLAFYGNSKSSNNNLAVMSSANVKVNNGSATLFQADQNTSITKQIVPYAQAVSQIKNNQFQYEVIGITTSSSFKNKYTDLYQTESFSDVYQGSLKRKTQFLNAFEASSLDSRTSTKTFSYSTYVFNSEPNLFELFTKSDPCLIFKLNSPSGFANLFQESGFMSAAINCFVKDLPNVFDTKLVYRIYFSNTGRDYDPNKNNSRTLKIINKEIKSPELKVEIFDNSWDFTNVLVTGNIEGTLQQIITQEIINSEQSTFDVAGNNLEMYCAIYAFSELRDNLKSTEFTQFSSLSLPLITFSINQDFVLVLPIYYSKSFSNGGTLQALRDFGYFGAYIKDTNSYTVITRFYNGQSFDTKSNYSNTLSSAGGYNRLLVALANTDLQNTKFNISVKTGSKRNPAITQTDYILDVDSTSNNKVSAGTWKINLDYSYKGNAEIKFEVDLINRNDSTLIIKLLSSGYQKLQNEILSTITVPFFMPPSNGILVLKLFIKNYGTGGLLEIEKISLPVEGNTLEYFKYSGKNPEAPPLGFYEDLPIQPTEFIPPCTDYLMYLDLPSAGFTIFDPEKGLAINGALYSPTWVTSLPENMEVKVIGRINSSFVSGGATGVQPYQIFFRTGAQNEIQVIDSKRNYSTGQTITVYNTSDPTNPFQVKQIVTESRYRLTNNITNVTTVNENGEIVELNLRNPVLAKTDNVLMLGQKDYGNTTKSVALNLQSAGYYATQPTLSNLNFPLSNETAVKSKIENVQFVVFDFKDKKTFVLGVTQNGNLIYSEDQYYTTTQGTNFTLIEGDPNNAQTREELDYYNIIKTSNYYGTVAISYPGIYAYLNACLVFYVYKKVNNTNFKSKYVIYARSIAGGVISEPIAIYDLQAYFEGNGINVDFELPAIGQISIGKNDLYSFDGTVYIVFDCGGKLFFFSLIYQQRNFMITNSMIIAGNLSKNTNTSNQKFIEAINSLIQKSVLFQLKYTGNPYFTQDIDGTQKVGFVDFDGVYLGVQFFLNSELYEILFDKSFSYNGEIRKITSSLG